jgi:hypothetical protein
MSLRVAPRPIDPNHSRIYRRIAHAVESLFAIDSLAGAPVGVFALSG